MDGVTGKPSGYGVYNLVSSGVETATLKQGLILNYDAQATSALFVDNSTTWYDRSDNGNDGTLNNFGSTSTSGWSSTYSCGTNGLVFDGSNDWVNTGIIDTANKSARSYAVTFKATSVSAQNYIIGNWETGGGGIYFNGSKYVGCSAYVSSAYKYAASSVIPTAGTTYKVVMTFDGSNLKFYINGALKKTTTASGTLVKPASSTVIGIGTNPVGSSYASSNMFTGVIYSAHVFDKALTAAEVTELYNSEVARGR